MFSPHKLVLLLVLFANNGAYAGDLSPFYVELFGGQATNVMGGPDAGSATRGAAFVGQEYDIHLDVGKTYGVRAGYVLSDNYRFDISYSKTKSDLDWYTSFPPLISADPTAGVADMDSQIILISAYYDFNTSNSFSPYVGVGIGLSRNEFKSGEELLNSTLVRHADLASNTKTQPSSRY